MDELVQALKAQKYRKNSLKDIAREHNIKESELKRLYQTKFFQDIANEINLDDLSTITVETIESNIPNQLIEEFKFIRTDLQKIINKSLNIAMTNGFTTNINHVNSGVMTANAGDSAEFIFVARAILAGFNCSSVDVRSSRYDAIIDYNKSLLRVQIKGISSGNVISFKDRDRGGQGIDHHHERNIGQRITKEDCDIYVAVDKQVALCYIIPMSWVDTLKDDEIKSVNLSKVQNYKENWNIVKEVAQSN